MSAPAIQAENHGIEFVCYFTIIKLPENSVLDVLVSKGIRVFNPNIRCTYEFPSPGLMRFNSLSSSLKQKLAKSYDMAIYINCLQTGLSFENIVTLARNCGEKVYEYQAGKQFRLVKSGSGTKSQIYSIAS